MVQLGRIRGKITSMNDLPGSPCAKLVAIQREDESILHLVIDRETYILDQERLSVGDMIVGLYDLEAPALAIYPPQYRVGAVIKVHDGLNVFAGYFSQDLVSTNHEFRLNISSTTQIRTMNGQNYRGPLDGPLLIVLYGAATRSIPAQVTPSRIIVQC